MDFAGYTTFSEVTTTVCNTISIGTEGRLQDTRDGKWYWVRKMKDNNCWMTQNLDYDGGGNGGSSNNVAQLTPGTIFNSTTTTEKLFYDPGEYIYSSPAEYISCAIQTLEDGLTGCLVAGWITPEVLTSEWTPTYDEYFVTATNYIGLDGKSICDKDSGSIFGNSDFEQCKIYYYAYEHYLIGNYYNWQAATNGTGSSVTTNGNNAYSSICPKGWSLPLGQNNVNTNGTFAKLLMNAGKNVKQAVMSPYYFLVGGEINAVMSGSKPLMHMGNSGYYWSATGSVSRAYSFSVNIDTSSWNLAAEAERYYGYSVRCVAR